MDAMYGGGSFGDVHLRVDTHGLALFVSVGVHLQVADFDDAVGVYVGSRRFQVKEHDGIL